VDKAILLRRSAPDDGLCGGEPEDKR